jgi:hypothetical protein
MIEFLTYMVATIGTIAGIMLIYLVTQIYSSNSPYRQD